MTPVTPVRGPRLLVLAALILFLVGHLPALAPSLEDLDSVNFALGVRDYDVAKHQPHPPGYPIFVAVSKLSTAVTRGVSQTPAQAESRGLAVWGAMAGALVALPLFVFFRALDDEPWRAALATALTLATPLFWLNASRPMSDVPGLAVSIAAQAVLASAFARQRRAAADAGGAAVGREELMASGRLIVLGALLAGLAIGMRSQSAWLTFPMLALVLIDRVGRDVAGALLGGSVMFGVGVLAWLVPLVWVTGGPEAYIAAFSAQAGEDIAGVDMLATNPTVRRLAFGLLHTFVYPWASTPLAVVVLAAAVVGAALTAWRSRRALLVLAAIAGPYGVFHLVFQETQTTRYALPLVPVVAWLAVRGFAAGGRVAMGVGSAALVASSLLIGVPATVAYAGLASPWYRALSDVQAALAQTDAAHRPVLAMHHAIARTARGETAASQALPSPAGREWTHLVDYWLKGGARPVWFLVEPRRTDLALFDASAQQVRAAYRWPIEEQFLIGNPRPGAVDWVEVRPPGWFATDGWALTPEIAGVSERERRGPSRGGSTAWIRRRPGPATLLLGGRNLGHAGEPDVRFTLTIDDRVVHEWTASPAPGFFLFDRALSAGALEGVGEFARLVVTAQAADGSARPVRASVEQFDLQDPAVPLRGFGPGWHEMEYAPATGLRWRWSSDVSRLRVLAPAGADLELSVTGESPLRYFSSAPTVRLVTGTTVLHEFTAASDISERVRVAASVVAANGGEIRLETTQTFVPDERSGNGDRRRLGLRIYSVDVKCVSLN